MKTEISFKKTDGSAGVALMDGSISTALQAKRELAAKLDLPLVDAPYDQGEDIDARLRHAHIVPESVRFYHVSE